MDEQKLLSSDMDLLKQGIELSSEQVELWLDENRQWSEDYFRRKATVEFVLEWIHVHESACKMHGIYTKKTDASIEDLLNNNKNISEDIVEDISSSEDVMANADETLLQYQGRFSRRFSEPVTSSRDLNRKGFRLRRNHSLQSQIHATIPEDENREVQLRKYSADSHFSGRSPTDTACTPIVRQRHRSIAQLGSLIESRIKLPSTKSLDQGKKLNLKHNNEDDFFYEIIKDIANNLNLKTLSYNILVNIGILTNADRCSLFLVEGPKNRRSLVSELFDVHPIRLRTNADQNGFVIRVPWGKGIVGYAAETGQTVNIHDAYAVREIDFYFYLIIIIVAASRCS
jgi:dual 3',5'-cyclic-AMP and -GMP phosphodiesterase 11